MNCLKSIPLLAPKTFRKPTSVDRFADRAVDKLMKLMQAIIKIRIATAAKIYTREASPLALIS